MSFFFLILALSALAYVPQFFLGDRKDYRMAMRHGSLARPGARAGVRLPWGATRQRLGIRE